ncbi:MAG: VWA domain-containing protein [Acidimicrobiia bacterium]|nr:VWA domain-containing protein [Acidimicrobiia bacterium]
MKVRVQNRGNQGSRDDGAIMILAAFLVLLVFAAAALAIDISLKSKDRQHLWNTADAAALAGASQLPDNGVLAAALATQYANDNDPSIVGSLGITFRCLVGDRNGDGQPDPGDVPTSCDSRATVGPMIAAPPFVCAGGTCVSQCNPVVDRCNTLVVDAEKSTQFHFAPVIGVNDGTTSVRTAACRGACGGALSGPVDLILIIDRTTSMSDADLDNAKNASLGVLNYFNPSVHNVGLAALGSGDPNNTCNGRSNGSGDWLLVGLSNDYKNNPDFDFDSDGAPDLDSSSNLVNTIQCLNKQTGTNLGSPINDVTYNKPDALTELISNGRPGVKKGIILMSDGEATQPGGNPCQYARNMATIAKDQGVEIFTIGFGIGGSNCNDGTPVSQMLAAMATGPTIDNCLAGTENTDDDHFFCEPGNADLQDVFLAAASSFESGSKLVFLPPGG